MFRYFGAAKLLLSTAAGLAVPLALAFGSTIDSTNGYSAATLANPISEQLAPTGAANQAPVANAGVNRSVTLPANQLVLSGTGTDADGTVVAYHWQQVSGPSVANFSSFDVAAPTISGLVLGSYIFSLVVTDDQGANSVASQATITVFPANQSPVANAGTAQTIVLPTTSVKLSGTGTDADGTVVAYRWQQVSGPSAALFSSATVAAPTVSALVAGSYVFSLVVTDNQGANSVANQVTVKVIPANQAPVASAGTAQLIVLPTASAQLAGTGSAAPGHTLAAYRWRQVSGPDSARFSSVSVAAPTVSALVAGSYVFALTVTDEQGAASAPSQVTITVNPATTGAVAYRLNAGGAAVSTSRGSFAADAYFAPAPGTTYAAGNASVAATADPVLYRTERAGTRFSYALPVSNGTYSLVLHFAEFYWTQPGQRVFDVAAEGRKVLTQYDIVKKVGPFAATTETLQVTVADGVLNLDFSALFSEGGRDQAKLSALEVLAPISAASPPTAYAGPGQTLTLPTTSAQLAGTGSAAPGHTLAAYRWRQVSGPAPAPLSDSTLAAPTASRLVAGSYVFALTVTDEQGAASAPSQVTITVNPATTGAVAYRLNAGGAAVSTSRGSFAADAYFAPAPGTTYVNNSPLTVASPDPVLYRTERAGTRFSYALPVSNGTYSLVLHFAEFYWTQPGQRVFDVAAEGRKVLTQYDIVKKVGPFAATTETLQVTVADGVLNLDFSALFSEGGRDQAKVSAIEVLAPISAASPPTAYAGPGQTLTLPTTSAQLAGTGSAAPGHTLAAYRWRQVSGPDSARFSSVSVAAPTVSALVAGSYVFALTVTDEQGAASAPNQVTITVNPATTGAVAYRLNAGGGAVSTSVGEFAADAFFTPAPGTSYSSMASVSGAAAPALYRTERAGGRFSYALPVSNGTYSLVLHFAEFYWTQPGQRVFDVAAEGRKVLTQYDIVKKVGPFAATTETLQVTVADGVLNLDFSALPAEGGRDQAKLSALEVLAPISAASPPTAYAGPGQTLTLPTTSAQLAGTGSAAPGHTLAAYRWRQVSGPSVATFSSATVAAPTVSALVAGSYVFSLVVTDEQGINSYDPALAGTTAPAQGSGSFPNQVTITVNPATTGAVAYRLNAGGGAVSTSRGSFAADAYFAPAPGTTYVNNSPLTVASPDPVLYRTERAGTRFSYALPVSNGTYSLVLHFAEFYWTQPGQRVFDVAAEGRKVLTQYDIVKKVGPLAATTETLQVTVADGVLNLDFSALFSEGGRDQAKVNAIEVLAPQAAKCPDVPAVNTPLAYCVGTQAGLLSSSVTLTDGATLRMYASDTTKTQLAVGFRPPTTAVATTNYYVTQVLNGCESARARITVAVGSLTPPVLIPPAGLDQNNIAAWGDSFTDAGYGQYPRMLSQLTGLSVFNGGIGGETSAQTKIRMTADTQKRNWPCVIWSGRNDSNNQPQVLASIASMVASLGHSNYLIVPIFNGQNEGTGSYAYSQIGPLNSALAKTYGNHYLDVRAYIVSKYDSTKAQDVIDHAANTTPASLRSDFLHPNIAGSNMIASYIYANLNKLFSVDYYQGGSSQPLRASFKVATGGVLRLYASSTSLTALPNDYSPPTTQTGSFTYYASQLVNGCESSRTPVTVNVVSSSANGLTAAATYSNSTAAGEFTNDAGADVRQKNLFAVYPNPAADVATVELRLKKDQQYTLELYDMKGARIKQIASGRAVAETRYSFQLKNEAIPNGIYYIRLLSDKSSQTLKLIVNR